MTASIFTDRYKKMLEILSKGRKSKKMSQGDLGKKIDISQPDISKMERGIRRIDVVEMMDMAEALDLDSHDIISELQKIKS